MKTSVSMDALAFPSVAKQAKGVEISLVHSCRSLQFLFAPDMVIVPEDAEINHRTPLVFPSLCFLLP